MKKHVVKKMLSLLLATSMLAFQPVAIQAETAEEEPIVLAGYRDAGRGSTDPYYVNANLFVWEPLIGESDEGEAEPRLATSWEMSEDAKEWTFHLKEGVVFSDGYPFDADAVLLNFERYRNMGVVPSVFFAFDIDALYPGLQSVEKIDQYTVKLTFENPVPTLPNTINNYGSCMFSPDCYDPETGEFKEYCVGTGPFVVTDHVPEETLTLGRNELYYGEPAKAESIQIRMIPDHETRVAALRSGEVMGLYDNNTVQPQAAKELDDEDGFTASSKISDTILYVNLNNRVFPFNDVRMRQAVSMIIDRDVILDKIYCGFGETTINLLSPLSSYYKDITPEYDPEKAKELAAEVLNGETPTVRFIVSPTYETDSQLIGSWLEELGMKVDIQIMESAAVREMILAEDYEISMEFKGMNNLEPETMLRAFMHTEGSVNKDLANYGYHNEEVDEKLEQLNTTYNVDERVKLYDELQEIGAEELPIIPLIARPNIVVHSDEITGYDAMYSGATLPETCWAE